MRVDHALPSRSIGDGGMKLRKFLLILLVIPLGGCTLFNGGPVARFEVSPPVIYAGDTVWFDGSTSYSDKAIISYGWSFSDGGSAFGEKVSHAFSAPGHYTVTLSVTDAGGGHATVSKQVTVYMHSGTEIFSEDFSDGEDALSRWPLDPAWASEGEGWIENVQGSHGFVLHIKSGIDRWHRRYAKLALPPLRSGQKIVFSIAVKTAQNQDAHGFFIFPARKALDTVAGSLPYFRYSSEEGGSLLCEPSASGNVIPHVLQFTPKVYLWYTYKFVFSDSGYEFYVNNNIYSKGNLSVSLADGGDWLIILGDESKIEACDTYYDDIKVWVEE